jgi:hypothetical protein
MPVTLDNILHTLLDSLAAANLDMGLARGLCTKIAMANPHQDIGLPVDARWK